MRNFSCSVFDQISFPHTGTVERAEVKHKKAQDSEVIQSTFAFITISIDDRKLEQCLQEFKEQQFRGQYLQVSEARENFLEKLKREREEASQHQAKKAANSLNDSSAKDVRAELPSFSAKIPSDDESSSESSSSEEEEEEEEPARKAKTTPAKNISRDLSSDSSDESDLTDEEDSTFLKKKSKRFLENGKVSKIDKYLQFIVG